MPSFLCSECDPPQLIPVREKVSHRRGHDRRKQWSSNRDQAAHARFRRAVKERDGYRCVVCGSTRDVRAAHIVPVAQGGSYEPENGRTLCKAHDMATDPHAR